MRVNVSSLLELLGIGAVLAAAGLWDLRALLALVGVLFVFVGYSLGVADEVGDER